MKRYQLNCGCIYQDTVGSNIDIVRVINCNKIGSACDTFLSGYIPSQDKESEHFKLGRERLNTLLKSSRYNYDSAKSIQWSQFKVVYKNWYDKSLKQLVQEFKNIFNRE